MIVGKEVGLQVAVDLIDAVVLLLLPEGGQIRKNAVVQLGALLVFIALPELDGGGGIGHVEC